MKLKSKIFMKILTDINKVLTLLMIQVSQNITLIQTN